MLEELSQTKDGREIKDQQLGNSSKKENFLEQAESLTKKYRAPTSADVTEMLQKKVTEEIISNKVLDLETLQF